MRQTPIVGAVGVDFGHKPAISYVVPRKRRTTIFEDELTCCPTVTLLCDSITASKSKCGYTEFSGFVSTPPKYYLKNTYEGNETDDLCCGTPSTVTCNTQLNNHADRIYSTDPVTCAETVDFPAGVTDAIHNYILATFCDGSTFNGPYGEYVGVYTVISATVRQFTFSNTRACAAPGACAGSLGSATNNKTDTFTLSDEYTTAALKSNAIAALPAYSGTYGCGGSHTTGQGCLCTALTNLSSTESSYTIRRFKHKFTFTGTLSGELDIFWNETFKPTLTGTVVFNGITYHAGDEDPDPVHWTTTPRSYIHTFGGDPCSSDTEESDVFTVDEPASNGTIYITDIRWSNDSGYEPTPNNPEGIYQYSTETPSPYGGSDVDPAEPNCFSPA